MSHDSLTQPLSGIKILDLTIAMAGPLATSRLGDLGADVIKIESPAGDFSRQWPLNGYSHGGDSSAFLMLNRSKRSIVLDLKTDEGRELLYKLIAEADVLVQNFRPGVAARLAMDFDTVHRINPALVYVSISGYGDEGPMVERPGQDLLVQSFSGLTFNAGVADGLPHPSPVYIIDTAASHLAAQAVLAGYIDRLKHGTGRHYKVSLLAAALEIQIQEVSTFLTSGRGAPRSRHPFASNWMDAPYGIYATADSHIALAHARLPVLAEALDEPRLEQLWREQPGFDDEVARSEFRDGVGAIVAENFRKHTTEEWIERLTPLDIWVGPVLDYAQLAAHPQSQDLFIDVDHPGGSYRTTAPAIRFDGGQSVRRGPKMGEHTDEVLGGIGLGPDEIARLRGQGVVA